MGQGDAQGISGINFSTLKKIANFCFDDKVVLGKLFNSNTYVIYIDADKYREKEDLADRFEDFFNVTIKGM